MSSDASLSAKRPRDDADTSSLPAAKRLRVSTEQLIAVASTFHSMELTVGELIRRLFESDDEEFLQKTFKLFGDDSDGVIFASFFETILTYPAYDQHEIVTPEFYNALSYMMTYANDKLVTFWGCFSRASIRRKGVPLAYGRLAKSMDPALFGKFVARLCNSSVELLANLDNEEEHGDFIITLSNFVSEIAKTRTASDFWEIVTPVMNEVRDPIKVQAIFGIASPDITHEIVALKKGNFFGPGSVGNLPSVEIEAQRQYYHHALWAPMQLYKPDAVWPMNAMVQGLINEDDVPDIHQLFEKEQVIVAAERIGIVDMDFVRELFEDDNPFVSLRQFYSARIVQEDLGTPLVNPLDDLNNHCDLGYGSDSE